MISVTKLRKGVTFEENGQPYRVQEYFHAHMSRGGGTIRIKARNLLDGGVKNFTFKSGAEVEEIEVERKKMQYLYADETQVVLMDPISFEQVEVPKAAVASELPFLKEGEEVLVFFWEDPPSRKAAEGHGRVLGFDLPANMAFAVTQTDPGEKGDSVSNVFKPATLANGLVVKVPLFIKTGERVRVDTRTREYVERVKG
ncbi:MAG: elongation factor P [Candidatus Chisholmbacteria bacterium]|nr:elongation factor P [Candidatus Chisholmbacteria bacterium]